MKPKANSQSELRGRASHKIPKAVAASAESSAPETFRLLILDDDANLRKTLSGVLELDGYKVDRFGNSKEALEKARSEDYSAALIDLKLPDMSGLEALRELKQVSPDTECILLTGYSSQESAIEAINLGIFAFFQKPYQIEQLLLSIMRAVQKRKTTKDLIKSEEQFKYIYDNSVIGKSLTHISGEINVNRAFCEMLGYSAQELQHKKWQDLSHPDDIENAQSEIDALLSGKKQSARFIKRYLKKDGSVVWAEVSTSLRKDDAGKPLYFMTSVLDITERQLAEIKLDESQALLSSIIDSTDDFIWSVDSKKFGLLTWNKALQNYFFRSNNITIKIGDRPEDLFQNDEFVQIWRNFYKQALKIGNFNSEYRTLYGTSTLMLNINLLKQDGKVYGLSVFGKNITDLKQAEESLRKTKNYWQSLVENTSDMVSILDANATILYQNPASEQILGIKSEEIIGRNATEFIHPDDWPHCEEVLSAYIHTPQSKAPMVEFRIQHRDGSWRYIEATGEARDDEAGHGVAVITSRDITERKQAEEILRESEYRFRALSDNSLAGINIVQDGVLAYVNVAMAEIFGYLPSELIGATPLIYVHPDDHALVTESIRRRITGDAKTAHYEFRGLCKNGEEKIVEVLGVGIELGGKPATISNILDITERKHVEEALRESESKFRSFIEQSTVAIGVFNLEGFGLYANQKFLDFLGLKSIEEMAGRAANEFFVPQLRDESKERTRRRLQGLPVPNEYESVALRADGSQFPVYLSIASIEMPEGKASIAFLSDISERKQAERFIKDIITKNPMSIQVLDKEGFTLEVNPAYMFLFGSVPPADYSIFNDPQLAQKGTGKTFDQLRNGEVVYFPDVNFNAHDSISEMPNVPVWVRTIGFPILDSYKKPERFVLMHENITKRKQAEEAQQEMHKALLRSQRMAKVGTWTFDPVSLQIEWSEEMYAMYGLDPAVHPISISNFKELIHPDDQERYDALVQLALSTSSPFSIDLLGMHPDGTSFQETMWGEIEDKEDGSRLLIGTTQDITELRKVEEALREREELFRSSFESSVAGISFVGLEGNFMLVNQTLCEMLGYKEEELLQLTYNDLTHPEDKAIGTEYHEQMLSGKLQHCSFEKRYIKKNGDVIWVFLSVSPIHDQHGQCLYFATYTQDITERKLADAVLNEREELFQSSFDSAVAGICLHGMDGKFIKVNHTLCEMLGYSEEELLKLTYVDLAYEEDIDIGADFHKQMLSGEIANASYEKRYVKKDGTIILVYLSKSAIHDLQGNCLYFVTYIQDFTERKHMEDLLRESEILFRSIFEQAGVGITQTKLNGAYLQVNSRFCEMTGYTPEDFHRITYREITHPDDLAIDNRLFDEMINGERHDYSVEKRYIQKNGEIFWANLSVSLVRDKNGIPQYTIGIVQNISERRSAEEQLYLREERYRSLVDTQNNLISRADLNGNFTFVNDAYCKAFGTTREKLIGRNFLMNVLPEDREIALKSHNMLLKPPHRYTVEDRSMTTKGLRWLRWEGSIVRDNVGNIIELQGVGTDITEQKLNQIELQDSLINLRKTVEGTIETIALIVEARDPYTSGHQKRVADISVKIAEDLGLSEEQIRGIYMAGIIHDLGKIQVPAEILSKPGKLSKLEFDMIKIHPKVGYDLLKGIKFPWPIAQIIYQHHERMDGTGYPRKLKGEKILLEARIIGIADVIEAMSSHRPYRPALKLSATLGEINKNKDTLYDKEIVESYLKLFKKGYRFDKAS